MKVDVLNREGKPTGRQVELDDSIFGIEPNEHAVSLAVKSYLAAQRQGTSKSKERGEITGSRKKLKRQKGTGTARAGDIKSPIFRGGGRIFGPKPRTYNVKLNKKLRKLARYSALSVKAQNNSIVVIEDIQMDQPKTKDFASVLANLNLKGNKNLLVTKGDNENLSLSARNIAKTSVAEAALLNTYQILGAKSLIITESAVEGIQ